jgi:ATP-dependent protease HslVU (ClpYQ) peptidase subunit
MKKERLSIDTAIETVAYLIGQAIGKNDTAEVERLQAERKIILGLAGTEEEREQLFDKVINEYSNTIKQTLCDKEN